MGGEVRLDINSLDRGAKQAITEIFKENEKLRNQLAKLSATSKQASKEEVSLNRQRLAVLQQIQSPSERYKAQLASLLSLKDKGKLSEEQYARAVAMTTQRHKQAFEQATQGQVKAKAASDQAKRSAEEQARAAALVAQKQLQAQQAGQSAFGARALGDIKSLALGLIGGGGLAGAVYGVVRAFKDFQAARETAASKLRESVDDSAKLLVAAGGDMAKAQALQDTAEQLLAGGGVADRGEAARVTLQLERAGARGEAPFFGELGQIVNLPETIGGATKIQAAMGRGETGPLQAIVSKAMAAGVAGKVSPEDILAGTAKAARSGRMLGLSDEEVMAAVELVARQSGDAAAAGSEVDRLFMAMGKRGFIEKYKGKPLAEMLAAAKDRLRTTPAVGKFFGKGAPKTFADLTPEQVQQRVAELHRAEQTNVAEQVIATRGAIPGLETSRFQRRQEAGLELQLTPEAEASMAAQAVQAAIAREESQRGYGALSSAASRATQGAMRLALGDEDYVRWVGKPGAGTGVYPKVQAAAEEGVARIEQAKLDDIVKESRKQVALLQQIVDDGRRQPVRGRNVNVHQEAAP